MPIVGTAGHVDHGKSTLVRLLTGQDPDRWELERQRGLTIDLGFAWCTLPGGAEVGFVDVPGHDRYARNMLAGIGGIDLALFVVAADDGWKPQSEEHLAVLDLLRVDRGVVAVTKTDAVDAELLELQMEDIVMHLAGSSLEHAPLIPVSAVDGSGIDRLAAALGAVADGVDVRDVGRPRLWVDRSFTVDGAGLVVTGTLRDGSLAIGQQVVVHPRGELGRIRAIEVHEQRRQVAPPGSRVALNLTRIKREHLERGVMIGVPGQWEPTSRISALLQPARDEPVIRPRGAYQVHVGAEFVGVRLRLLDSLAGGTVAVLDLASPLTLASGDRFVLRDAGRRHVVGGGQVLDPAPSRRKVDLMAHATDLVPALAASSDAVADVLLAVRSCETVHRLAAHSGGGHPRNATDTEDGYLSAAEHRRLADLLHAETARAEAEFPTTLGVRLAELAQRAGVTLATARLLVETVPDLVERGGVVSTAHHATTFRPDDDPRWHAARDRLEAEWPTVPALAELDLLAELIKALQVLGHLVRVSDNLAYLPGQVTAIVAAIDDMDGSFTVGEFCTRLGVSRRYGVPILEWADRRGHTRRRGDHRQSTAYARDADRP